MKNILAMALLALGAATASAQPTPATPAPADWTHMTLTADVALPAYIAWDRIGGNDWCGIAKYLDIQKCEINSGKGELGSVRTINGSIVEIVVARTLYSYTYAQPFTPIFYHGTLGVEPTDATHSRIVYTLMWNQAAVGDKAAQEAARTSRQQRFQAAVDKMAAAAKAP
jgi:hypothetical protein